MQTLNINLPEDVMISEKDVMTAAAIRLYDTGKVTIYQAAAMAGADVTSFIEDLMAESL